MSPSWSRASGARARRESCVRDAAQEEATRFNKRNKDPYPYDESTFLTEGVKESKAYEP